jgi:ferredoxin
MTPFGIRKRLKSLLGMGQDPKPQAPPRPKYSVTFVLPDGSSYESEAKEGDSLVLTSNRGPYPISQGCSDGTCATCRVEVLAGHGALSQADGHEEETKSANGIDQELRLACQTAVLGADLKVRIINVLGEDLVEG